MKLYLAFFGICVMLGDLQATNRYFNDLEATSPNGRFRLEAKSLDNVEGPWKVPFQARFNYRLFEKGGINAVWSREQPMGPAGKVPGVFPLEGPPVALRE